MNQEAESHQPILESTTETDSEERSSIPGRGNRSLLESISWILLLLILILGGYFRFVGLNWDDFTHLHPDERFLTIVTSGLQPAENFLTYLRTSESGLNPYNQPNVPLYVYGNFPMTMTYIFAQQADSWVPLICGENAESFWCGRNLLGYDGVHLVGRALSGLTDLISILFTFLIGRRLYGRGVGLLAAFFMATAVMPIQQSHFYTMDNWAAMMTTIAIYMAIRASESGTKIRWWIYFGLFLGLAMASRINVGLLGLIAGVAGLVWLGRLYGDYTNALTAGNNLSSGAVQRASQTLTWDALRRYFTSVTGRVGIQTILIGGMTAALISIVTFRIAMPYAFADAAMVREQTLLETGQEPGTVSLMLRSVLSFHPQFLSNMDEIQRLQEPEANWPPAKQWTDRPAIIFPLNNMILYGMGIVAGTLAWIGVIVATWRIASGRPDWLQHAIPVAWIWLYFLFSATRWVKSIRYFLPIYPVLFIMAGWFIMWGIKRLRERELEQDGPPLRNRALRYGMLSLAGIAVVSNLLWANGFVGIYQRPMTRIAATEWMFDNVPTGATLIYETEDGARKEHLLPSNGGVLSFDIPYFIDITLPERGRPLALRFNYFTTPDDLATHWLEVDIKGPVGESGFATSRINLPAGLEREPLELTFEQDVVLEPDVRHTVQFSTDTPFQLNFSTSILTSESWDDGLPTRYKGRDPFSQYYRGLSSGQMASPDPDSEQKKENFYNQIVEADYIILSSQRAIWSLPRQALTYPLMIRYYEALFNGELGFDLVAEFHGDIEIGPLYVSDTTGQVGWGEQPNIGWPPPNEFAAEEAFSVYDHPPVWIFEKRDDFDKDQLAVLLSEVDLSRVVVQNPLEATNSPNGLMLTEERAAIQQEGGTFSELFNVDGLLSNNGPAAVIVWWLTVIILGLLTFPLTFVVFPGLADRGYTLSRITHILLLAWGSWLVASWGWFPNSWGTLIGLIVLISIGSGLILWQKWGEISRFVTENWRYLLFLEGLGIGLFLLQLSIRLLNPDVWHIIWGGEKPMDTSYFTAVLKSTTFPPYDPWHAGGYINYYYFGFVYTGVVTKLLGIIPTVAYNLILPMLFSFTGLAVFNLAYTLANSRVMALVKGKKWRGDNQTGRELFSWRSRATIGGLIATLLAVILGNLREINVVFNAFVRTSTLPPDASTISRFFEGGRRVLSGTPANIYPGDWFWTATRAITINPGEVQPITEFPFFTFLYGDLHAHMIALPLSLIALGWAISLVLTDGRPFTWLHWLIGGLSIGVLYPTNSWDYPTYLVVAILAFLYINLKQHGLSLLAFSRFLLQSGGIFILSRFLFQPFWANFGTAYGSVRLWEGSYTPVSDFLGIYGLFLLIIVTWLFIDLKLWGTERSTHQLAAGSNLLSYGIGGAFLLIPVMLFGLTSGYELLPITLILIIGAGLLGLRRDISPERRIVNILFSSAMGLVLAVEIIVLDGDIGRMNTVFKFYMQVWIFLSVAAGAAFAWSTALIDKRWSEFGRLSWRTVFALLIAVAALYPLLATRAKWQIREGREEIPLTLDGAKFMEAVTYMDQDRNNNSERIELVHDYKAIKWLQQNIEGSPVIAEAHSTNPYRSIGNRISMYTGLPSIIGWDWHQRQQRPTVPGTIVSGRIADVDTLYRSESVDLALEIIEKYDVRYIYAGQLERLYYGQPGLTKFDSMTGSGLLSEVYNADGVKIYQVTSDE